MYFVQYHGDLSTREELISFASITDYISNNCCFYLEKCRDKDTDLDVNALLMDLTASMEKENFIDNIFTNYDYDPSQHEAQEINNDNADTDNEMTDHQFIVNIVEPETKSDMTLPMRMI